MQEQLCSTCSAASKRQPADQTAAKDMSQMVPMLHGSDATGGSPALHMHHATVCNLRWRQHASYVVQAALPCIWQPNVPRCCFALQAGSLIGELPQSPTVPDPQLWCVPCKRQAAEETSCHHAPLCLTHSTVLRKQHAAVWRVAACHSMPLQVPHFSVCPAGERRPYG